MKKITFIPVIALMLCISAAPTFGIDLFTTPYSNFDDRKNAEMSIVPDRASGEAQVRFKSTKNGDAVITVTDESGKVLLRQSSKFSAGINNISITSLLTLDEGTYTVRLVTNNQTYSSRLLLWK
jgi:hypothetical protein